MSTPAASRSQATPARARRRLGRALAAVASAALAIPAIATTTAVADASVVVGDGLSPRTAAASCWEVKEQDPAAPDGTYWLLTPQLGAPERFYCDQTTDGGGWVLIGRGREWWSASNEGRGPAEDIWQRPTGTAAFAPRQLPARTVDGLLGGGRVDELEDGVRLRRATDTAGTAWQEVRFRYATNREHWSWQLTGVQQVGDWQIGSATGRGGTTASFGTGNGLTRVDTQLTSSRGWAGGFGYGSATRGSPAASSYLWSSTTSQGYARPFTQVFLRPRLLSADVFAPIPASGLPAVPAAQPVAESFPLPTTWTVSGLGAAGTGELNTEVAAFAEVDGIMYVGGNFRYVQRSSSGADRVEQSYLAAFDARTGEWIPSFRPQLDHQVKALAALPDGTLAVGGAFRTVNGNPSPAFVVLDGAGDTVGGISTRVINYTGGTSPIVRSLDVRDGYIYLGGSFTHMTGGGSTSEVYLRNLGRVSAATGAPDPSWHPLLDGTVVDLHASPRGDRVYAAGYFGTSNWTEPTPRAGAFTTADASVIPWVIDFSNTAGGRLGYQQAVREVGDQVWVGGAEHMLFSYDRDTMVETSTNITQNGGDFQVIADDGVNVIAGCHCSENVYQGARKWPGIAGFHRVEHINQAGYWSGESGAFLPDFSPTLSMREGSGAWAIAVSETGTLWLGGDFTYARQANTQNQWTGGLVRFRLRDVDPPPTPQGVAVTATGDTDELGWSPVSESGVTYEVLRADRVVATTSSTSVTLPAAPLGSSYFVRTVDAAGNRSATSPAADATERVEGPVTVVAEGSEWRYHFAADAPGDGWQQPDFDDATWSTGQAPIGWGHTTLGTTLPTAGTRPLTSYYRTTFDIEDATQVAALQVTARADDGVVLYLNGTEIGRANMPEGTATHTTYATAAPNAHTALTQPLTIDATGALLTTGTNTLTAEVHSNWRTTPSHSFELAAVAVR